MVLTLTAVAAVLVGSGALARTLPFRPAELLPTAGDRAEAPPAIGYAVSTPRAILPYESAPPSVAPSPSGAAEPTPPATPRVPRPAPPRTAPAPEPAPAPDPEPVTVAYEAENAELSGFVRLFEVEAASGGDVVGMIGQDAGSHVRFPEVTVDATGEYELTLYYVSAPDRQATVTVNDGEPVVLEFPGLGDANEVGAVSVPVALAAGPNVVWFGNVDQPAPALDRITVTG